MSRGARIDTAQFRIAGGKPVRLGDRPTRIAPLYESRDDYHAMLAEQVGRLSGLQHRLYAANRNAVLLIFQAMDAAGKDSAIRHVMSGVNPQGCQVHSFAHPSATELDHDFLWRTAQRLPERGHIGIFNRSYYEDVLIVRVHPEILAAQGVPHRKDIWEERFESIRAHEAHLHRSGTRVAKFFLHLSKEEQRKRFIERIEEPHKHWKFSDADIAERAHWPTYMRAYEAALRATSTPDAPWYCVPADDQKNARLIIAQIVVETIAGLKPDFPKPDAARRRALQRFRRRLERE